MRLFIAWLLPKDWLAAPFRRRFHCAAHMFCRPPLVGLHSFQPVAVRREEDDAPYRPGRVLVQSLQEHFLLFEVACPAALQ